MKTKHEQFAEGLVASHGLDTAKEIVEGLLKTNPAAITFFDEADFVATDNGRYQFAKVQGKKAALKKDKRCKDTINFYTLVLRILNKGNKNARKN